MAYRENWPLGGMLNCNDAPFDPSSLTCIDDANQKLLECIDSVKYHVYEWKLMFWGFSTSRWQQGTSLYLIASFEQYFLLGPICGIFPEKGKYIHSSRRIFHLSAEPHSTDQFQLRLVPLLVSDTESTVQNLTLVSFRLNGLSKIACFLGKTKLSLTLCPTLLRWQVKVVFFFSISVLCTRLK